ncbi:MAG: class I SAM-dependent methyltransferase, partial [Burkholderiales bacterium]
DLAQITEEHLKEHDQDHFGGLEANDILIAKAGIQAHHLVLDVCSGMGGPARYFALRTGCRVVGLDFTESRLKSAEKLTAMVKLDDVVSFKLGNALEMPFEDDYFDVVIGQEAWCHIPQKEKLIAQCTRVLKPGGVLAFTDILRTDRISQAELERLGQEMTFSDLGSIERYRALLTERGNEIAGVDDLSALWADILVKRLAMYRSLKETTARKFGEERHREWDRYYSFFVGMYSEGKLGGARFVARKRWDYAPKLLKSAPFF